ncbi:MAG: hypothetical protein JF590_02670 [Gemmatimonadetes bacterium]|nr:hypothetical protein [Gemmatimonadota bacterium]
MKPPAAAPPPVQPPKAPAPPKPAEELPDLELIDLDLTPEPIEAPAPPPPPAPKPAPPAPKPPVVQKPAAAAPPPPPPPPVKRPTPPPAPAPEPVAPRTSAPRLSTPRVPAPIDDDEEEVAAAGGSKKGIIIGAIVLLAAAGGGFAVLSGKKGAPAVVDTIAVSAPVPPTIDTARHDSTATDTTKHDSTAAPVAAATAAPVDTAKPAPAAVTPAPKPDANAPATGAASAPVPFAPSVARGPAPWTTRPIPGAPLSIPALESVRLRYLAAQGKALDQYESGLEANGFTDLFDPAKVSNADRRSEAFDGIDAGRSALRDFRRRQAAIDFAYSDSMRQAMPPGSDTPDFRTFGPILRETPAQAALTDSLIGAVAEMYGLLTTEAGGYTFRAGSLTWKDPDNAERYQTLEEQLTAQIARIRMRAPSEIPPAMAATLRGIGLPR